MARHDELRPKSTPKNARGKPTWLLPRQNSRRSTAPNPQVELLTDRESMLEAEKAPIFEVETHRFASLHKHYVAERVNGMCPRN